MILFLRSNLSLKLWDYVDSNYGAVAILLSVLLVLAGVTLHASIPDPIKVTLAGVSLLAIAGLDYYVKRRHERHHALRQHSVLIKSVLNAAASSVLEAANPPVRHVRACLMFLDEKEILRIKYEHGFVATDRDRNIEIPKGTGCCGQAWLQGQTMMADLTEAPVGGMPNQWGLPAAEIDKIRKSLRSILSVPVRAGEDYSVVAVLNIDSDNSIDEIGFRVKAIQEIAYSFATVLGSLMDESLNPPA